MYFLCCSITLLTVGCENLPYTYISDGSINLDGNISLKQEYCTVESKFLNPKNTYKQLCKDIILNQCYQNIAGDEFIGFENPLKSYNNNKLEYEMYFSEQFDSTSHLSRVRIFKTEFCNKEKINLQSSWSKVLDFGICNFDKDLNHISVYLEDSPIILKYHTKNINGLELTKFPWKNPLSYLDPEQTPDEFWLDWEFSR